MRDREWVETEAVTALRAAVQSGLAEVDAVNAACPANRQRLGDKLCPTCNAGPDEGCRKDIIAMYKLVTDLRAALTPEKANG